MIKKIFQMNVYWVHTVAVWPCWRAQWRVTTFTVVCVFLFIQGMTLPIYKTGVFLQCMEHINDKIFHTLYTLMNINVKKQNKNNKQTNKKQHLLWACSWISWRHLWWNSQNTWNRTLDEGSYPYWGFDRRCWFE